MKLWTSSTSAGSKGQPGSNSRITSESSSGLGIPEAPSGGEASAAAAATAGGAGRAGEGEIQHQQQQQQHQQLTIAPVDEEGASDAAPPAVPAAAAAAAPPPAGPLPSGGSIRSRFGLAKSQSSHGQGHGQESLASAGGAGPAPTGDASTNSSFQRFKSSIRNLGGSHRSQRSNSNSSSSSSSSSMAAEAAAVVGDTAAATGSSTTPPTALTTPTPTRSGAPAVVKRVRRTGPREYVHSWETFTIDGKAELAKVWAPCEAQGGGDSTAKVEHGGAKPMDISDDVEEKSEQEPPPAYFSHKGAVDMKVCASAKTHIGGANENQDDFFLWKPCYSESSSGGSSSSSSGGSFVLCVLDGHGRDVGKLASKATKDSMMDWLEEHWEEVVRDPAEAMKAMFFYAHTQLLHRFKEHMTSSKWSVDVVEGNSRSRSGGGGKLSSMLGGHSSSLASIKGNRSRSNSAASSNDPGNIGYIVKKRAGAGNTAQWSCVHGGTSASVIVHIAGSGKLVVANVGDSDCLVAVKGRELRATDLIQMGASACWPGCGGAIKPPPSGGTVHSPHVEPQPASSSLPSCVVVTAEHSPESAREFVRMRTSHPSPKSPMEPELLVVYDALTPYKMKCSPCFRVEPDGAPRVTKEGKYFKNVRKEWASLVATPAKARFQDALAFTRSIGDYHLQTYGVSHVPDVQELDLADLLHRPQLLGGPVGDELRCCIALCSDGVWDNWEYQHVGAYVMKRERLEEVKSKGSGVQQSCAHFMKENTKRGSSNFGSQADNATTVLCYLTVTANGGGPTHAEGHVSAEGPL